MELWCQFYRAAEEARGDVKVRGVVMECSELARVVSIRRKCKQGTKRM